MNIIKGKVETCQSCGTIYNYDDNDLKYIDGCWYPYIECPTCGQKVIYVPEMKMVPMKPIIEVYNDKAR